MFLLSGMMNMLWDKLPYNRKRLGQLAYDYIPFLSFFVPQLKPVAAGIEIHKAIKRGVRAPKPPREARPKPAKRSSYKPRRRFQSRRSRR